MFKIFGAIGRYFRAICYVCVGRIDWAKNALYENKHVIAATYDESIRKDTDRALTVQQQVADLAVIRNELKIDLENRTKKLEELTAVRNGAQRVMQNIIDKLRQQGKPKTEIESDAKFVEARSDYIKFGADIDEVSKEIKNLEDRYHTKVEQVEGFKQKLKEMQRSLDDKKSQKSEVIADMEIAKSEKAINASLTGLTEDQTDKDIESILRRRDAMVQEAQVSSEMANVSSKEDDAKYKQYAQEGKSISDLDNLLDWGEESSEKLDDAKIAE